MPASFPAGNARLLVVDDAAQEAGMMRLRLEASGYQVLVAGAGADALALIQAGMADLVLLDVGLPDVDGFEVCRRIRVWEEQAYGHSPVLPVVMVTGLPAQERVAALEAGADDFLGKPINQVELLARVRSLLRIKSLHDQLEARNRLLFDALQRSVSDPVARQILENPEQHLRPGGERRTISVMFADLRGYSTIAESVAPATAIEILNTYLGVMIEAIFRYGGTVNQLLGDGVMALFGAPIAHPDHAWCAVQAALDIRDACTGLTPPGLPEVHLAAGAGITTGEAIVGHIGSEQRVDYTAVGAVVNLAARFQSHAGPGQILITAPTYQSVRERILVQDAGTQSVRGHLGWVQAYSVIGRA